MTETLERWPEANQRYLAASIDVIRALLHQHAVGDESPPDAVADARRVADELASRMPAPAAVDILTQTFQLSPFERDIVLLCAGMELDARMAHACAAAQGQVDNPRPYPTFSLALAALPLAHWTALLPSAPLRHWRLVELVPTTAPAHLTTSQVRIDERLLHFLAGLQHLDEHLESLLERLNNNGPLDMSPSQERLVDDIVEYWTAGVWTENAEHAPAVQLCGADPSTRRTTACAIASRLGRPLYRLTADGVPQSPLEQSLPSLLWAREAVLSGSILYFDADSTESFDAARTAGLVRFLERLGGGLIVAGREPLPFQTRPAARFDVLPPARDEQRALWTVALGRRSVELQDQLDSVVAQFSLTPREIQRAAAQALAGAPEAERGLGTRVWNVCRAHARTRLDDLAQRISSHVTWSDLILPAQQQEALREIAAQVRQRTTVYDRWGFAEKSGRGLGISVLFSGPSGTGKTMAAEVLANELRVDLYAIDLSAVVSKYIGETEKNLRRVFDAAEAGAAILLFDEADALFGKRSEVKDSHDRYANIEVSYLLQRMEAYRGLAILTTNNKTALDAAFLRRLRFVVNFPFPDPPLREAIWQHVFPVATPLDGFDPSRLARLNVAGGNIRNIACGAAFLAADLGEPVRMAHLLRAAQTEYAKLDKSLTDAEVAGWS